MQITTGGGSVLQDNKDVDQEVVQTHLVTHAHGHRHSHHTHQDHLAQEIAEVINVEGHQSESEANNKIIIGHGMYQSAETLLHTQAYLHPRLHHHLRQVSEMATTRAHLSQTNSNKSKEIVFLYHLKRLLMTKNMLMNNSLQKN